MKKLVLFVLLLPALALAQSGAFGHGGSSLDLSTLLPIIADSSRWTDGSTVNAIKPRDAKTVEADSAKIGSLEVTGNTILDGNLTMVTTATEQVKLGTGSDAAPELSSVGDPNTGVRFPGSDVVTGILGGAEKWRWTTTGLGINKTPAYNLDIYQNAPTANQVLFNVGTSDDANRFMVDEDGDILSDGDIVINSGLARVSFNSMYMNYNNTVYSGNVSVGSNAAYQLYNKNTPVITLANNLNVGINTTTPGAKQEIAGAKSDDTLLSVYNDVAGLTARDSSFVVLPNGNVGNNKMVTIKRTVSLADQAEYTPQIPAGMCGWGKVMIGDFVEWARFHFKADGTVTLETNSTNVGTTNDVDAKLNIYDGGTGGVIIENQLGSTLTTAMVIECYTP